MTAELRTSCTTAPCAWRVTSAEAWEVVRLQMFTDRTCETEVSGHAIAGDAGLGTAGCSGISVVGVDNAEKWCGDSASWIGLYTSQAVQCVRVGASATSADELTLSLTFAGGVSWTSQETWSARYEDGGSVAYELQRPCEKCAWRVTSTASDWGVVELKMFTDTACSSEVTGHAIASASDCEGISKANDGALGSDKWCGGSSDWVGLTFATTPSVKCVHASGDVSIEMALDFMTISKAWSAQDDWRTWAVLSRNTACRRVLHWYFALNLVFRR